MDTLWAPWRIDYIEGPKAEGCIFCACVEAEDDEKNLVVHRGERCFVILNRYPYNNGHIMVVPFAHEASIEKIEAETLAELMAFTQLSLSVLREAMHPGGSISGSIKVRRPGQGSPITCISTWCRGG